jgi:hypothetical protein
MGFLMFLRRRLLAASLALAAASSGCNLFGNIDKPSDAPDQLSSAIAMANAGDCSGAKDLLVQIPNPNDEVNVALGWAYLCMAGATASTIATSIYNYTSTSTDYTVVGILARSLLPIDGTKTTNVNSSISAFSQIYDQNRLSIEVAIAQFVKAAIVLGRQAVNAGSSATLERTDISASTCQGADCTSAVQAALRCNTGMSHADIVSFADAINAAATALNASNAANLQALAAAIKSGLGVTDAVGRCFIMNQTIPAN